MEIFKNKVGRPSNATIRNRRIIKVTLTAVVAATLGTLAYTAFLLMNISLPSLGNKVIKPDGYKKVTNVDFSQSTITFDHKGFGSVLTADDTYKADNDYYSDIQNYAVYYATGGSGSSKIRYVKDDRVAWQYSECYSDKTVYAMSKGYCLAYQSSSGYSYLYKEESDGNLYANKYKGKFVGMTISGCKDDTSAECVYLLKAGKKSNKLYIYKINNKSGGPTTTGNLEDSQTIITLYKTPAHTTDKYDVTTRNIECDWHGVCNVTYNVRPKDKTNIIRNYRAWYDIEDLIATKGNKTYPYRTDKFSTCNKNKSTKKCKLVYAKGCGEYVYVDNKNKNSYFYTEFCNYLLK